MNLHQTHKLAIRLFTYFSASLLVFVGMRSVWTTDPLIPADVVVFTRKSTTGPVLTEVRKYVGRSVINIGVNRILFKEGEPENYFVAESGGFEGMEGEFAVATTYVLPGFVSGRWCSAVSLTWWPSWSQREYTMPATTVCFETTEYE